MTVALAFDGDTAGTEAMHSALLNLLPLEDDVRSFLRSYVFQDEEYSKAITYLSNESLAWEYRKNIASVSGPMPEWYRDYSQECADECMKLINYRSSLVESKSRGHNYIDQFNEEHTVSSVLQSFGVNAVPGRTIRCPAHDDSSPSLKVFADDRTVYCFNQSCLLYGNGHGVSAFQLNKILSND